MSLVACVVSPFTVDTAGPGIFMLQGHILFLLQRVNWLFGEVTKNLELRKIYGAAPSEAAL